MYSRGAKSGGFNATWSPTTLEANVATTGPVGQAVLDSFEIGGKHELLDRTLRVSGAAFLYLYQGKQQSVTGFAASPLSTLGQFIHSGDTRIYGAAVEITYKIVRAPCRRRACQYGKMQVVSVALN